VWALFRHANALTGPRATLLEWDEDIPDFETVHGEAKKALVHRPALRAEMREPAAAHA
jgi:hypothetical protein